MKKATKKSKTEKEPTLREIRADIRDVFDAVGKLIECTATHDKRFDSHDRRFDAIEEDVSYLKRNMVTKIYLDEKNGELRGDISELVYKEDRKFVELVHILENKNILSEEDTVRILSMPPFPLGHASK